jgi:hypothetical protein
VGKSEFSLPHTEATGQAFHQWVSLQAHWWSLLLVERAP